MPPHGLSAHAAGFPGRTDDESGRGLAGKPLPVEEPGGVTRGQGRRHLHLDGEQLAAAVDERIDLQPGHRAPVIETVAHTVGVDGLLEVGDHRGFEQRPRHRAIKHVPGRLQTNQIAHQTGVHEIQLGRLDHALAKIAVERRQMAARPASDSLTFFMTEKRRDPVGTQPPGRG